ncbi:MAG: FAD-dependent oxidoreductase [Myxococcaceae bacterium]|nr:FAD-dependent oxidoreductase [Myxococcaceae bacterium]
MIWLFRTIVRLLVRLRLGRYRFAVSHVDPGKPLRLPAPKRVAVAGAGLAGLTSAITLAERGYDVTLYEANGYIGGKVGSWPVELEPGRPEWVSHGFHAFFRHYYNLNRLLDALGVRQRFAAIADYRILLPDSGEIAFDGRETTPVLNLLSLASQGVYRMGEVLRAPTRDGLGVFLEYDPEVTPKRLDHLSLAEFDRRVKLPPRLKLAFNTFARAFFANEDRLSMAVLVKGFHSYYLGHAGGLVYDHPSDDFEAAFLVAFRARLEALGVKLRLSTPVQRLSHGDGHFEVDGARFDDVVLATDVGATRRIIEAGSGLGAVDPRLRTLEPGERYAVLRLWLDRAPREGLPVFVITERHHILDAISFVDRAETESRRWVEDRGGSVIELHCYAVPEHIPDGEVQGLLEAELYRFLPELSGATVRHRHAQLRRDFAAFHVGRAGTRPGTDTGVAGLYCAGDWVNLPFPAMLMEAAVSSGLVAANRIFERDGLREALVESIPLRGLLAGLPQSPGRKKLLGPARAA